ncbi:MAG: bifunctional oligoribonuclease/PAP phosphatase NrnA [Kiritimatiellia bacterium]
MAQIPFAELLSFFAKHKKFLVSGHVRPDGDSIGSAVALCSLLNRHGHDAFYPVDADKAGAPAFLLAGSAAVPFERIPDFDAVVCVDCASADRLDPRLEGLVSGKPVACIDHHHTNTAFGIINCIDPEASSTGELICRLADAAEWTLNRTEAEALWVSIVTDSGRFAYELTSPETLRIAARLKALGVRSQEINDRLYCCFTRQALELKRRAFNTLEVSPDGRIASVCLSATDFLAAGAGKSDAEDIIEIPRSVAESVIALYLYQTPERPEVTRLSIRTRAPLDATRLAGAYGGGGHLRAAGCDINLPLEAAKKAVLEQIARLYPVAGNEVAPASGK